MMEVRRLAVFLLMTVVMLSAAVATFGYTSGTMDREIDLALGNDGNAYVGIETHSPIPVDNGRSTVPAVTIRNNFGGDVRIRVNASVASPLNPKTPPRILSLSSPFVLGVGEEETIRATVVCGDNPGSSTAFTIAITVTGSDVSGTVTKEVIVTCSGNAPGQTTTDGTSPRP